MQKIHFYFHDRTPVLNDRRKLKQFIELLFKKEQQKLGDISYIFCSDEYLLDINKKFLQHDFYTDVISFDLNSGRKETEAEVYISVDRIRENAKNLHVSFKQELHRVIFHGALHLCGYRDKKKTDRQDMRDAENRYLNQYFK